MTELYVHRAAIHYNRGNSESAIDDFNKAIERQLTNPKLYYGRGVVSHKVGNYERIIAYCDMAI